MRFTASLAAILLVSCGGPPDVYAPAIPRKPIDVYGTDAMSAFVRMNSADAPVSIVHDIAPAVQAGAWRWASQHAELRFFLPSASGWNAKVEYSVARAVLEETGPLTMTFFVNNAKIDSVRHESDGRFVWQKPVPESILVAGGMNYLRIETDKSGHDAGGHPISFILTAAGFVR